MGSFVGLVVAVMRLLIGAPIVTRRLRSLQPGIWFVWFIWFVLFVWLNETNQMNQIDQKNQKDQTNQITRKTYCSSGLLRLDRRAITTNMRMVKPKSQRLGRP